MRSVVVLPQPDGPSSVAKEPRGTSNDTSSTAVVSPNFFVTWSRRRWTSGTSASERDAATRQHRDDAERRDGEPDVGHGEGCRSTPVQVADQLEDTDRRDRAARREEEDDDGERRNRAQERRDEPDAYRAAEH